MFTEAQLNAIGFVRNPMAHEDYFNEWRLEGESLCIGDYNNQGYLIHGFDEHTPIDSPEKLKALVMILYPDYYKPKINTVS